jgi:hypothetical protein
LFNSKNKKDSETENKEDNKDNQTKRDKKINPKTLKPYLGKRTKRGLFSSSTNKLLNAEWLYQYIKKAFK